MDQATFEANARAIRKRFTGTRRDLLLHINDAGGGMDLFDLLRGMPFPMVAISSFLQLHRDGVIVVDGRMVRFP